MKQYLIISFLLLQACSGKSNSYSSQNSAEIALTENYKRNEQSFDHVLDSLVYFKHILYIKFIGIDRVSIKYLEQGSDNGMSIEDEKLSSSQVQKVIAMEDITLSDIEKLRKKLNSINCESITMYKKEKYDPSVSGAEFCFGYLNDLKITYQVYAQELDSKEFEYRRSLFDRYKNGGVLSNKVLWIIGY